PARGAHAPPVVLRTAPFHPSASVRHRSVHRAPGPGFVAWARPGATVVYPFGGDQPARRYRPLTLLTHLSYCSAYGHRIHNAYDLADWEILQSRQPRRSLRHGNPDQQRDAEGASRVVGDPRPRAADRWSLRAGGHRPNADLRRHERRQLRPWPVLDGWHDAHGCAGDPQWHRPLPRSGRTPAGHGAARPADVPYRHPPHA